jgi:hypothetical protein
VENWVNSKPEQKVYSLPLLGLVPVTFGVPTHRSVPSIPFFIHLVKSQGVGACNKNTWLQVLSYPTD